MLFPQSTIRAGADFNKCHHEILRLSENIQFGRRVEVAHECIRQLPFA